MGWTLLFVYGTLRRGCPAHRMLGGSRLLGAGWVGGYTLVDLGEYPGAVPAPARCRVRGEVYRVSPGVLGVLDDYEDVPELYTRERVRVALEAGGAVEAWMYVYREAGRVGECLLEEWSC